MKLLSLLSLMVLATGCATSNIRMSADICREGDLATYVDDDFNMSCQRIDRIIAEGPQPTIIQTTEMPKLNCGPGAYCREIISRTR